MKKLQEWKQEQGTYYAINKQRKQTYRRVNDGPWESVEPLSAEQRSGLTQVGWDRVEEGWFSVFKQ